MNVYKDSNDSYYYGTIKRSPSDEIEFSGLTAESAYSICAKKNFNLTIGVKRRTQKKNQYIHGKNPIWEKENSLLAQGLT